MSGLLPQAAKNSEQNGPILSDCFAHEAFISLLDLGGSDWIRKPRTKFSPDQLQALEMEYQIDPFLSTSADKRSDLAKKLKITEKNVQIWFQVSA